jgi:pilus assembly protein CpaE
MDLLNYPRDRWRIVLNRADSKVGLAINEVEKSLRATISAQIPSSRDVPAAINRGVPIVLDDPRHPVSVAIKTFSEHYVANVNPGPGARGAKEAARPERRGLLRRRSKA